VAKGKDLLAERIRQVAQQYGVPIVQRPPLARALYVGVEVGQEVPPAYYRAVAEVLAYVYQLSRKVAG
jgi:flagellar biosynthetic protein FlhB